MLQNAEHQSRLYISSSSVVRSRDYIYLCIAIYWFGM